MIAICINLLCELVGAQGGSGGQGLAETPVGCRWRITSVSQVIKCPSHPCRRAVQPRSLVQSPSVRRTGATICPYITIALSTHTRKIEKSKSANLAFTLFVSLLLPMKCELKKEVNHNKVFL